MDITPAVVITLEYRLYYIPSPLQYAHHPKLNQYIAQEPTTMSCTQPLTPQHTYTDHLHNTSTVDRQSFVNITSTPDHCESVW